MKKQLSIALMTNNYRPMTGGVPIFIERLAKGLMEQGHQVTVFAPTEGMLRYLEEDCSLPEGKVSVFAGKTPVIALKASGVEDIVTEGKTGLLTEENPDSFARAIGRFLSDTTFRNELSRNAFLESLSFREEMVAAEALRRYNESIVKEKCESGHGKSVSYSCG